MTPMYRIFLLFALMWTFSGSVRAQIQYVFSIDRPDTVTDAQITSLFEDYPDIRQVAVRGNMLTFVVPDRASYPVITIREWLAKLQVSATDYKETELGDRPDLRVQKLESTHFKVYGVCGMCQERIERAARSVKGVVNARWDVETQILTLKYRSGITDIPAIHEALVAVGHDTESRRARDEVYEQLHTCCKYERPAVER